MKNLYLVYYFSEYLHDSIEPRAGPLLRSVAILLVDCRIKTYKIMFGCTSSRKFAISRIAVGDKPH